MLPSQRDLAKHHGVALATVRRALDRLYAEGALEAHRGKGIFVRSSVGRSRDLSAGKVALTFVGPDVSETMFPPQALTACQEILARRQLEMVFRRLLPDTDLATLDDLAGLLLAGPVDEEQAATLTRTGHPFVVAGAMIDPRCPDFVGQIGGDLVASLDLAMGWLVGLGHRRIALATVKGWHYWEPALDLFRTAASAHDVGETVTDFAVHFKDLDGILSGWRSEPDRRPTALLVVGGMMAGRLIPRIEQAGLHVPADVSVVALNHRPVHELPLPEVSCVHVDEVAVWCEAAKTLIRMMETGQIIRRALPPRLVWGETCRRIESGAT
jgi:DNA-binding LacI/PurR family transcriptional regulator